MDPKFRRNARPYIAQCLLATTSIFMILLVLDTVTQTALLASVGASAFIAFSMPHINASKPRYLLGGYIVGTLAGCGAALIADVVVDIIPLANLLAAALATGSAIFLMVITDTEHPPAAALAMGYVLNEWNLTTVLVVFIGVIAISVIKECGRDAMINLL